MLNRLIIIGNGFDLAHGLKTKYSDFIRWYWINLKQSDELVQIYTIYEDVKFESMNEAKSLKSQGFISRFEMTNNFFLELNQLSSAQNWVDIEMFYYQKLKDLFTRRNYYGIEILNREFDSVRVKFKEYVLYINSSINHRDIHFQEMEKMFLPLHNQFEYNEEFLKTLPKKVANSIKDDVFIRTNSGLKLSSNTMILNFNYTNTLTCYNEVFKQDSRLVVNHIPGEADSTSNDIIFGFGDERDDLFSEMEKVNKNEFLRFMKSTFYLQDRDYFDLLNFIEEEKFIVEILGHSCALSDRTLLKNIFEHPNCQHIFLSYFSQELNGIKSDNFLDLSLNIARHFSDKTVLRSKVANKLFCKMLPQRNIS